MQVEMHFEFNSNSSAKKSGKLSYPNKKKHMAQKKNMNKIYFNF